MKKNFFSSAVYAGLISGFTFIVLQMVLVTIFNFGKFWGPPRMISAIVLGKDVLPPPAATTFWVIILGFIIHFILAIVFAIIIGLIVSRISMGAALGVGLAIGLALYFINFYAFTGIFPWFAKSRIWVTVVSHLVYGFMAAWCFKSFYGALPTAVPVTDNRNINTI